MKYNYLSLGLIPLSACAFDPMGLETGTPAATLHITRKQITTAVEAIPSYYPQNKFNRKNRYAANQKGAILKETIIL